MSMSATKAGADYIGIHLNRLCAEGQEISPEIWQDVAAALSDDLALTVKRLGALDAESKALKDNEALCNRDKCGYINEYKKLLQRRQEILDEAIEHINKRNKQIEALRDFCYTLGTSEYEVNEVLQGYLTRKDKQ